VKPAAGLFLASLQINATAADCALIPLKAASNETMLGI
jgi:hypothetical protein